jgi:hypothetical protein
MPGAKLVCCLCGKKAGVGGGYYGGVMRLPSGKGEWRHVGFSKMLGRRIPIVEWTGKYRQAEYFECRSCCKKGEGVKLNALHKKRTASAV